MSRLTTLLLSVLALLALSSILISTHADSSAAASLADDDAIPSAASTASSAIETAPFSAYDFFTGEWDVYRHLVSYSTSTLNLEHSLPSVRWSFAHENTTSNLFGRATINSTEGGAASEQQESSFLRVEFHDPSSGIFQTGSDDDSFSTLFSFSFMQVRGSVPVSVGTYHGAEVRGEEGATYVLQASSPDRFTLIVTPKSFNLAQASKAPAVNAAAAAAKKKQQDDDDDLTSSGPASTGHPLLSASELAGTESYMYVGHRIRRDEEKSFLQKYGTMILLGAMLLLNVFMRTKQSANQVTQASRAAGGVGGAKRRGGTAPGGAQIEEIVDEGAKKDK